MKIKVEIMTSNAKSGIVSGTFCDLPPSLERVVANDPSILPYLLVFSQAVAKCALSSSEMKFSSASLVLSTDNG